MLRLQFQREDVEFTDAWWSRLCADPAKLNEWLRKLQHTELAGYHDNLTSIVRYRVHGTPVGTLLQRTALDEKKHAEMLCDVLAGRGLEVLEDNVSPFWSQMDRLCVDLASMSAVYYLGEALAAFRFERILAHPGTPADVREFVAAALKDEEYHARAFYMNTTDAALFRALTEYERVVAGMKR